MHVLPLWSFGIVALMTIIFFPLAYLGGRKVQQFWAWATGTEPPKEKVIVFLPLSIIIGLLLSGFVQAFFDAGSMCHEYHQNILFCTFRVLNLTH